MHGFKQIVFRNTVQGRMLHGYISRVFASTIEGTMIDGFIKRVFENEVMTNLKLEPVFKNCLSAISDF
jgi:hypothetical protein